MKRNVGEGRTREKVTRKGRKKGRKERGVGRREDGIGKAEKREKVVLDRRLDWV